VDRGVPGGKLYGDLQIRESECEAGARPHNAHVHMPPNFSAFDTVEQVVELAAAEDLALLCASNYYDHRVYGDFVQLAFDAGVFPLLGLEIILLDPGLAHLGVRTNDPSNPGRVYLCGLATPFVCPAPEEAAATLAFIRGNDERRMHAMIDLLNQAMAARGVNVTLGYETLVRGLVRRHGVEADAIVLQERHLAQGLQEALFDIGGSDVAGVLESALGAASKSAGDPVAVQGELRSALMKSGKPAYVGEEFVDFDEAKATILGLGGIPCYPILADGASPINEFEASPEELVAGLQERDIHMAQFIPRRNTLETVERYAKPLREAGIPLTVGTEHNTLELIPMQPACEESAPLSDELLRDFWEGACICAAHQVLVARGETGYVDGDGRRVGDPEQLARIGAGLVEQVRR